jgi:site-specific DNA-cytosine methylase
VAIDSSLVSAQTRYRLYWTNLPISNPPTDKGVTLQSVMFDLPFTQPHYTPKFKQDIPTPHTRSKFPCLRAYAGGRTRGISISDSSGNWRKLTPIELERLQTVPDNYTNHISDNQRAKALGNGWTVDVITHIFKGIS